MARKPRRKPRGFQVSGPEASALVFAYESTMLIPSIPEPEAGEGAVAGSRAEAPGPVMLRFEDVTEDGRFRLEALPNALGPTVWGGTLAHDPLAQFCYERGIVAILLRFGLEGTEGPFSARGTLDAEGSYRIAFSEDGRLVLDVWASLHAPLGRTYGSPAEATALRAKNPRALCGRVFAEHVFTRPFAPQGQRRVTREDLEGNPAFTAIGQRPRLSEPSGALALSPGVSPIDSEFRLEAAPVIFGKLHTDSNRHVNSIAYVRLFEELALRRAATLGRGAARLGRAMDVRYRKPCMSGETVRVAQRALESSGRLGVAAMLLSEDVASGPSDAWSAKAHTYAQIWFDA